MIPPPWVDELAAALFDEHGNGPRIGALASVDGDAARVRHVVCRRLDPDGSIWVASDSRSAKNSQLRRHPLAELALWLPRRREHYRLSGPISIEVDVDLWRSLSDSARAVFAWPDPGSSRDPEPSAFPARLGPVEPPPESFEALVVRPTRVEHLDLKPHPHRRRRWQAADGWAERLLNP